MWTNQIKGQDDDLDVPAFLRKRKI
jgi:hypothetical protein